MRNLLAVVVLMAAACSSPPPTMTPPDSGPVVSCDLPQVACATGCATLATDDANCGACGSACPQGQSCAGSRCYPKVCTDHTCVDGQVCVDGVCADRRCFGVSCAPGQACANGMCFDSSCANAACQSSEVCVMGTCTDAACVGVLCPAGLKCVSGACRADTCGDGVKNGTESDTDCGGICPRCTVGQHCAATADCVSLVCGAGGLCAAPSCTDAVRNGSEGDTDCGGSCPPCADGKRCASAGQCQSGVCATGLCQVPTCADAVKNGTESDLDCGAACPTKCPSSASCGQPADCASGLCRSNACVPPECTNQVKDGTETDVDCGGLCSGCMVGGGCDGGADCLSKSCSASSHKCLSPTCFDQAQNGPESDVDCGGTCVRCATGQKCGVPADCASGACVSGRCVAPTCTDALRNGVETDVDCGGDGGCTGCRGGLACQVAGDCLSASCDGGKCDAQGLLGPPMQLDAGNGPSDLLIADLDNDGRLDLAVINTGSFDINLWFSNGDGTFTVGQSLQVSGAFNSRGPVGLGVGDVNGDGRLDLVNAREGIKGNICGGISFNGCTLTVLRGAGNRNFLGGVDYHTTPAPFSGCGVRMATGRINADGLDDVIMSDGNAGTGTCGDAADLQGGWLNLTNPDGGAPTGPTLISQLGPYVAVGDLNGDGKADVVGRSVWYSHLQVFLSNGDGTFQAPLPSSVAAGSGDITLAKVDADNTLDVVVASRQSQRVAVARGVGDGNLLSPNGYAVVDPDGVAVADLDGDGKQDLVVGARGIAVLRGVGDGTFNPAEVNRETALGDVADVVAGDLNGDGKPDVACIANGRVYVLFNARP